MPTYADYKLNFKFVQHTVDAGSSFDGILARAGLEPNKLYPLCNEKVVYSDLLPALREAYPDYFFGGVIPTTLLSRALLYYYRDDEKVRLVTQLKKALRELSIGDFFKDAKGGTTAVFQKIAEVFGIQKQRKTLYVEPYYGMIDWNRGDFGNAHSCYWSERPGAKYMMDALFAGNLGGAFRVYSASGNGPSHPDNENVRGYGRIWAVCWHSSLAIFNPYPGHDLFDTYANALASLLGMSVSGESFMMTNNPRDPYGYETDDATLYINKDEGRLLFTVQEEQDYAFENGIKLHVAEWVPCSACEAIHGVNDAVFCSTKGWVCRDCCRHCPLSHSCEENPFRRSTSCDYDEDF